MNSGFFSSEPAMARWVLLKKTCTCITTIKLHHSFFRIDPCMVFPWSFLKVFPCPDPACDFFFHDISGFSVGIFR